MMTTASLRTRSSSRSERSATSRSRSIRTTGPNFDHGPNSGPFTKATIAAKKFAKVLKNDSVGDIASAACVSKETAKNWKLGKRMPNGESMLDLGTNLRSVKNYIKGRLDGHESQEAQQAVAEAEAFMSSLSPHQLEAVRSHIKTHP